MHKKQCLWGGLYEDWVWPCRLCWPTIKNSCVLNPVAVRVKVLWTANPHQWRALVLMQMAHRELQLNTCSFPRKRYRSFRKFIFTMWRKNEISFDMYGFLNRNRGMQCVCSSFVFVNDSGSVHFKTTDYLGKKKIFFFLHLGNESKRGSHHFLYSSLKKSVVEEILLLSKSTSSL